MDSVNGWGRIAGFTNRRACHDLKKNPSPETLALGFEFSPTKTTDSPPQEKCSTMEADAIREDFKLAEDDFPPADRGFEAWRFAFISFMIDAVVWGPALSFGIFLPYKPFSEMDSSLAGLIVTLTLGLLYTGGIIISPLAQRYPKFCTWAPTIGTVVTTAGLFSSSYLDQGWAILLTQGMMYGIGGAMIYSPTLLCLSEWWIERRGLAGGIMFAGSAVMGLVFSPVMEWSLRRYDEKLAMRGFAIGWGCIMLPLLPFIVGRLPSGQKGSSKGNLGLKFLKSPLFWFLVVITAIQSLAFYVPSIYLPLYASWRNYPQALVLELYSIACIFSQILGGMASDYIDTSYIVGATSLMSALIVFLLWGLCNSFATLAAFAILYGLVGPVFAVLWQRFAMLIMPSDPRAAGLVSIFFGVRGFSNFATGPVCGLLLKTAQTPKQGFDALVYFSGSLLLVSSLGVGMRLLYPTSEIEKKPKV